MMQSAIVITEPLRTLFVAEPEAAKPVLPEVLHSDYDGDLQFPSLTERPYVIANFVSTIDGAVSFKIPGLEGGGPISGANDGDRFIMGLLRASVDAVLVASATVNAVSPEHLWLPEYIYPAQKNSYSHYRSGCLRKPEHPLIAIVSGTGRLDLNRAVFRTPSIRVLVITTQEGRRRLESGDLKGLPSTELRQRPSAGGSIAPHAILTLLKEEFSVTRVLTEGGPTLLGEFLACGLVDEIFLTIAPQIAGRVHERPRPALVEGTEFTPATAPWMKLLSVKRAGAHLYLRYRRAKKTVVRGQ